MKVRYFLVLTLIWLLSVRMNCSDKAETLPLSDSLKSYFIPFDEVYGRQYVFANLDDTTEIDTIVMSYTYQNPKYFDDYTEGQGVQLSMGNELINFNIWCYAYLNSPSVMVDVYMTYYDPTQYVYPRLDSSAQFHKSDWVGHSRKLQSYSTPWKVFNDVIESDKNFRGPLNRNGTNSKGIGFGKFKWAKDVGLIYYEGLMGKDAKSKPELKRVVLKEVL
jgi:hypothetical protein